MEVLNDLLGYNLKIYQDNRYFKFSMDGVLLANFVDLRLTDTKILDIGTGTGIIPLILSTRTDKKIDAIEIQKDLCDLFSHSIEFNHLENKICLINEDIKVYSKNQSYLNKYQVIISNPPYYDGVKNKCMQKNIARNQESLSLDDLLICSKRLLGSHGNLFLVYDAKRFEDLIYIFNQHGFSIKKVQFVYDTLNSEASVVLVNAMKDGKPGMKILPPFILYDNERRKTEQYRKLFSESK